MSYGRFLLLTMSSPHYGGHVSHYGGHAAPPRWVSSPEVPCRLKRPRGPVSAGAGPSVPTRIGRRASSAAPAKEAEEEAIMSSHL